MQVISVLRARKCWVRTIVRGRCSTRQVPMPLVPSLLAPDRARPQTPGVERLVVAGGPAPHDRHAVGVGEQDAAAGAADRLEKPVEDAVRNPHQRLDGLPGFLQLGVGDSLRRPEFGRIKPVRSD
jgi:hypothetical protein